MSDGYLSIRIKPSTPLLGVVEGAYRELLALERSLEDEGATRRQAIDASATRLNDLVVEAGFKDYAGFMGAALAAELASREAARSDVPRNAARRSSDGTTELARILHGCSAVDRHMRSLFDALEGFARLNETLAGKAGFVRDLADAVRLLALNAMVSSARLERDGEVLGTIAGMLGVRSNAIAGVVERVGIDLDEVFELLSGLEFRISLATLQTEMTACFARELQDVRAATAVAGPGVANDLALLARCLRAGAEDAFDSLQALEAALARVGTHVRRLTSGVKALGALQTGGRIEATRTDAGYFVLLFREVADQVAAARLELAEVERTAKASRAAALSRGELEARRHLAAIEESALRLESTRTWRAPPRWRPPRSTDPLPAERRRRPRPRPGRQGERSSPRNTRPRPRLGAPPWNSPQCVPFYEGFPRQSVPRWTTFPDEHAADVVPPDRAQPHQSPTGQPPSALRAASPAPGRYVRPGRVGRLTVAVGRAVRRGSGWVRCWRVRGSRRGGRGW
ncbi:MAG: hypothetical protein R3C15_02285 [Thermoleophilia bacterium]